ncbi:hypothetical protein D3C87_168770 [compost metagenome]
MPGSKKPRKKKTVAVKATLPNLRFLHVEVTQERFLELSVEMRYCVLLLSHIQHEISWLQRMMFIASRAPVNPDDEMEKNGTVMQASLVLRLLLGKLNEFRISVNDTPIILTFLQDWCDPDNPAAGAKKVTTLMELFESNHWLRSARNKHFLHYPTLNDVRNTLEDRDFEWRFDMYVANSSMNSLCPTADIMANLAWYKLVDSENAITGLDRAYDSMAKLSRDVIEVLESSLGYFIDRNVSRISEGKTVSMKARVCVNDIKLPFFMSGIYDE